MVESTDTSSFTKKDRDLIRMEFMDRFGSATSIHEGFWLKRWATGPNKGQPKIPPAVQSMSDRGLVRIVEDGDRLPRVLLTEGGLRALVEMADDARAFQPRERYSHVLAEIEELRGAPPDG
jgi:hypothetical protein